MAKGQGRLEEMLDKVSLYLEDKFQNSTKITMNLLEPLIVVFLGMFVALIVLAISVTINPIKHINFKLKL